MTKNLFLEGWVAGVLELLDERGQLALITGQLSGQLAQLFHPLLVQERLQIENVLLQGGDLLLHHPSESPVQVELAPPYGQPEPQLASLRGGPHPGLGVLADVGQRSHQGLVAIALPAERPGHAEDVIGQGQPRGIHRLLSADLLWRFLSLPIRPFHACGQMADQPLPQLVGSAESLPAVLGGAVDHQSLLPADPPLRSIHRVVVQGLHRILEAISRRQLQPPEGPPVLACGLPTVIVGKLLAVVLAVRPGPD